MLSSIYSGAIIHQSRPVCSDKTKKIVKNVLHMLLHISLIPSLRLSVSTINKFLQRLQGYFIIQNESEPRCLKIHHLHGCM